MIQRCLVRRGGASKPTAASELDAAVNWTGARVDLFALAAGLIEDGTLTLPRSELSEVVLWSVSRSTIA